jgi:hypothetical protein
MLLDLRVPYFDPSFEAMIRMQCKFAEDGYEKLSGVQRCVNSCLTLRSPLEPLSPIDTLMTACATTTRRDSSTRRSRAYYRKCASSRYVARREQADEFEDTCRMYSTGPDNVSYLVYFNARDIQRAHDNMQDKHYKGVYSIKPRSNQSSTYMACKKAKGAVGEIAAVLPRSHLFSPGQLHVLVLGSAACCVLRRLDLHRNRLRKVFAKTSVDLAVDLARKRVAYCEQGADHAELHRRVTGSYLLAPATRRHQGDR